MSEELLAAGPDPRIGLLVHDRYRILKKLGEGGMGTVYEGEHTLIERKVAIKWLHAQFAGNAEMIARFRREATAANAVRHPNIVEVTDMGRFEDGGIFLVLEFLEGLDLATLLAKERVLSVARAVHILSQVCDALSAAHAAQIVHRDLKPENIFLTPRNDDDDFVKVLDFGIAKFAQATGSITRAGATIGTPHYMSPEHACGSLDIDHRADIYSLGVVLFQCLTGAMPFDDATYPGMLTKIVNVRAPRLGELSPSIPTELEQLVERMLAKDREERPQSCREVKAALAQFRDLDASFAATRAPLARVTTPIDPFDPSTHGEPVRAASHPIATPGKGKWIAMLAAALVAVAIVVLALGSGDDEPREATPRDAVTIEEPVPTIAPAEPARVRIQIDTEPRHAALFLDDVAIANPYDADLAESDRPRRLEARLEGHRTVSQVVLLSQPQRIHLELVPERTTVAAAPVARHTPRRTVHPPAPEPEPAPPSAEPPAPRTYRPVVTADEL